MPKFLNRSDNSIDFFCDKSAVLIHLGRPYIVDYKSLWNYQILLRDVAIERLPDFDSIEELVLKCKKWWLESHDKISRFLTLRPNQQFPNIHIQNLRNLPQILQMGLRFIIAKRRNSCRAFSQLFRKPFLGFPLNDKYLFNSVYSFHWIKYTKISLKSSSKNISSSYP